MLYHASPTPGLTMLFPQVSTHQKAYVYAIDHFTTALCFGAPKDDFDLLMDADPSGHPILWECYPDALERIYLGKRCSVYEVAEAGFLRGVTHWEAEWVNAQPVPVAREIRVPDLHARLLAEKDRGTLILHRYDESTAYQQFLEEELGERLMQWDMLKQFEMTDARAKRYFQTLIRRVKAKHGMV